jgi:hypothetical protein
LSLAMRERDQCQMDLIRCMASGVPAVTETSLAPRELRPTIATDGDGPPPSSPHPTDR